MPGRIVGNDAPMLHAAMSNFRLFQRFRTQKWSRKWKRHYETIERGTKHRLHAAIDGVTLGQIAQDHLLA